MTPSPHALHCPHRASGSLTPAQYEAAQGPKAPGDSATPRTSVVDFHSRCVERYHRLLRHVRMHYHDEAELAHLLALDGAVAAGSVTHRAALDVLSALRTEQQARRVAA